jgi:hypothetical protein
LSGGVALFLSNSRLTTSLLVLQLASLFRLGREVVLTKEEELAVELAQDWNLSTTQHQQQAQPKDSLKIRLWKMTSFPASSIPYLETHFSQPTGSLKYDEIDSSDDHLQWSQCSYDYDTENDSIDFTSLPPPQLEKIEFNCRQNFTVKWEVSYLLGNDANVSHGLTNDCLKRASLSLLFSYSLMGMLTSLRSLAHLHGLDYN